jgi:hypothetical protein
MARELVGPCGPYEGERVDRVTGKVRGGDGKKRDTLLLTYLSVCSNGADGSRTRGLLRDRQTC